MGREAACAAAACAWPAVEDEPQAAAGCAAAGALRSSCGSRAAGAVCAGADARHAGPRGGLDSMRAGLHIDASEREFNTQ